MNPHARRFGLVVKIGVGANLVLAVIALFFPHALLSLLRMEEAVPDIWLRFAAWLLILLSLFYIPPANDPFRSPATSWLVVVARVAGVVFFVTCFVLLKVSATYMLLGAFDLAFAIPEGVLLRKALSESK